MVMLQIYQKLPVTLQARSKVTYCVVLSRSLPTDFNLKMFRMALLENLGGGGSIPKIVKLLASHQIIRVFIKYQVGVLPSPAEAEGKQLSTVAHS